MKRKQKHFILLCLLLLLTSVPSPTTAQTGNLITSRSFWQKPGYFLMRFGFISGRVITLDDRRIDGLPGATFGIALDFRTTKHLYLGVSADVHRMHVVDSGQYFFDLAVTAKSLTFAKRAKIGFRPGIGVGFGVMDYFVGVDRTTFLTWRGSFETIFFGTSQNAYFLDVGMMGTAFGGNSQHDMRFGPFPYLRGGMMF